MTTEIKQNKKKVLDFEDQYLPIFKRERNIHQPKIGDIYFCPNTQNERYVRLLGIDSSTNYKEYWYYEVYNFLEDKWEQAMGKYSNEPNRPDSLRIKSEYYHLLLTPFDEVLEKMGLVIEGKLDLHLEVGISSVESDCTDVVTSNSKEQMTTMLDVVEMNKNKLIEIQSAVKCQLAQQQAKLDVVRRKIDGVISILNKQVKSIMRAIQMIELYFGIEEEIFQICEGEPAPIDTPLSIRQTILYMDEEVAVADNGGYDYTNAKDFYNWLLDPKHRDQVIPEKRCIIAMKPRRKPKNYEGDSFYNSQMNKWNFQTFVLIRNGENLYALESENLCVYGTVFPKKNELQRLLDEMAREESDYRKKNIESNFEDILYRSRLWAILVQGLLDRSEVFSPHLEEVSIFKNENNLVQFIYDAEQSLGDGHKPWTIWQEEINSTIDRGSRIIYSGYGGDFFKEYGQYSDKPRSPGAGLYTVEERFKEVLDWPKGYDKNPRCWSDKVLNKVSYLGFAYKPGGSYWSWEGSIVERKNRVFWIPTKESILNYDRMDITDIEYYLNSRPDREHYLNLIPLLHKLRENLQQEMAKEKLFIQMIISQIISQYPNLSVADIEKTVIECIDWWKYKVIWKRPITQDDTKAYKMIMSEMRKRLSQ